MFAESNEKRPDGTLYPDREPPTALHTPAERVDFPVRLCAAWDFGPLPERGTVAEVRKPEWRKAVDARRLPTSPAYHPLRNRHNLPPLSYPGQRLAYSRDDPNLAYA